MVFILFFEQIPYITQQEENQYNEHINQNDYCNKKLCFFFLILDSVCISRNAATVSECAHTDGNGYSTSLSDAVNVVQYDIGY
jgi:hypothetical protein